MSTILAEAAPRPALPATAPRFLRIAAAWSALAFLWFTLCHQLSYEWSANEQYSYGWFVPFFAAYLFWLRWEEWGEKVERKKSELEIGGAGKFLLSAFAVFLLATLLPTRLFEVANPDWRPLSWIHAFIVVGLSLLLIGYSGGKTAAAHFAFPVCFILVAVPWVTPIEEPIVQGLMKLVAAVATEALALCGIPAQLEGSLIRVHSGLVGVSEACSGVRSLQTSIMIGLLFGELRRLTNSRRVLLLVAAIAIALVANFARAFFLVWIAATQDLAAVERWHDRAGYAIVLAVFLGTVGLAAKLKSREAAAENENVPRPARLAFSPSSRFLFSIFAWILLVEGGVNSWYRWHERNFIPTQPWTVRWPESAPGFHELAIAENVQSTLRYDAGREASWPLRLTTPPNEKETTANLTMFFFRWHPGSTSTLRGRAHRPDICLPPIGWKMSSDDGVRNYTVAGDLALPFRHFRFSRNAGPRAVFAQAFFCEHEDRVPAATLDRFDATTGTTLDWNRSDRVRVVRQGLRNQGQQVMELVLMTPNELSRTDAEAEFARLLPTLVKLPAP